MAAINSKYHVKIGDFGFLLARMARTDRHYYNRKEAPHFVNKFSSGEPNYRDSTFFPHWVQLNWLNGFNQEFFDDGGKFYRSSGIDTTNELKLTLEKGFASIGQLAAGVNVTAQENYRTASVAGGLYGDTDLKAYYDLDGDSNDPKGSHNGTDTAITYGVSYGKFDQGASFNGTSSKITITNHADFRPTTNFSIFAYVKTSSAGYQMILQSFDTRSTPNTNYAGFNFYINDRKLQFSIYDDTAVTFTASGLVNVADGNWHMVTVIYNGSAVIFYVDAVQDTSTANTKNPSYYDSNMVRIGCLETTRLGTGYWFSGSIDEVALFSKVLTSTEITIYYNSLAALSATASQSSINTELFGTSAGKVYSWDGAITITELFDARRLEWFESGTDANKVIGDTSGTETAQAQSFQVDAACQMKAIQVYIKKAAGTPGDITVRIETNSTDKPSGTLVNDSGASTITAFTTETYGWITVEFPAAFSLAATTTYWIVLKTAAAANDQNYTWAADSSSPGYAAGTMAASTDGGSTWAAVTGSDAYFRVLGNTTSVNTMFTSSLSGSAKVYIGTGNQSVTTNGDARLYSYDGTTFVLVKIFNTTNESCINCIYEFGSVTTKAYLGLGHKAKIYSTTDWTTFVLAKTITVPNNPGYVLTMVEYNRSLYVGGGFPESLPGNSSQYGGFLASYDEYAWQNVGDFSHTVITALDIFDNLMFIGTIKRRLYVFNTASIDKLFEFPWDLKITAIKKWDDMLALATATTPGSTYTGGEGIYLFDRNGIHNAFTVTNRSWYSLGLISNNMLGGNDDGYVYQTSFTTYQTTGWLQTSYDEAQLPSIDKLRRSITLMYESMPTGCTIVVAYKTDESETDWTSLGTASTGTETTINFGVAVYSKKITFKVTLNTTNSSLTPTLKKIIHKYVLAPDFKYMWDMKLLCADNITWLDGEEPIAILETATTGGEASITLKSSNDSTPLGGFPDPNGSAMYCSIINPTTGVADRFSYTGLTGTTLTGIPTTGANALGAHAAGSIVRITGGDLHQKILDLKEAKTLYTFTDIDGLTYTVLFHAFSEENFVINQDDYWGGLENEVPITLLEA